MVILTRPNNIPGVKSYMPVCIIFCRPARKEMFYELCGMMSVRFDLMGATMCDARSPGVIDWYKRHNLTKHLAKRPQSVEGEFSEQMHDYGYKQTTFSKPIAIGNVQSWCYDHTEDCVFMQIISNIRDYDETQGISDWDLHDALQNAIIGIKDKPIVSYRGDPSNEEDPWAIAGSIGGRAESEIFNGSSTNTSGQFYDPFGGW
jgi:hypothetical protein